MEGGEGEWLIIPRTLTVFPLVKDLGMRLIKQSGVNETLTSQAGASSESPFHPTRQIKYRNS